jgi:hypothetical protein
MTDRYYALTVILDRDIREDDAQTTIEAIKMIKNVLDVKPKISNPETWMAESRALHELKMKLWEVLKPKI